MQNVNSKREREREREKGGRGGRVRFSLVSNQMMQFLTSVIYQDDHTYQWRYIYLANCATILHPRLPFLLLVHCCAHVRMPTMKTTEKMRRVKYQNKRKLPS